MSKRIYLFSITLGLLVSCQGQDNESEAVEESYLTAGLDLPSTILIIDDYLYVAKFNHLVSFDISKPDETKDPTRKVLDYYVSAIISSPPNLFVGGFVGGELSYSVFDIVSEPMQPELISQFDHAIICNPFVIENGYAFILERTAGLCSGPVNQLKVVDILDIREPQLVKVYPLTEASSLAAHENKLYICDGNQLKLFDSSDLQNIQVQSTIEVSECGDIIYDQSSLMLTTKTRISQFEVVNDELKLLSHLDL